MTEKEEIQKFADEQRLMAKQTLKKLFGMFTDEQKIDLAVDCIISVAVLEASLLYSEAIAAAGRME